jgi:hypothetical protein
MGALGTWTVRNAIRVKPSEIDDMLSYQSGASTFAPFIAGGLGICLNFYMDCFGGGLSSAANDTILPAASCPASVRMNISVTPR